MPHNFTLVCTGRQSPRELSPSASFSHIFISHVTSFSSSRRKEKQKKNSCFSFYPGGDILAHFPESKVSTGLTGFSRNAGVETLKDLTKIWW